MSTLGRVPPPRRAFIWVFLWWLVLVGGAHAIPRETWARFLIDGVQVGYSHDVVEEITYKGRLVRRTATDWLLAFKRFGVPIRVEGHDEVIDDADLRPLWVQEVNNAEVLQRSLAATWEGDEWVIQSTLGGKSVQHRWRPERPAYSYGTIPRLVLRDRQLPGNERRYPVYDFQKLQVVDTPVRVLLSPGPLKNGLVPYARLDYTVMGEQLSEWIDEEGNTLKAAHLMFEAYPSTRVQAEQFEIKEILPLETSTVKLSQPLQDPENIASLTLRVRFPNGDMARSLAQTDTQRILSRKGGEVLIELKPAVLVAAGEPPTPAPDRDLNPYLAADDHIQATDPDIVSQARVAVGKEKNPRRMAARLVSWVHFNVTYTLDVFVTSALATYTTRRGDCKGYAALLTALARAVGLPAREVFGLAYDPKHQAFAGHAWTEIYLGRWIPFDATTGGPPTATYIQFQELSPGDTLRHIRDLRIEVVDIKTGDPALYSE